MQQRAERAKKAPAVRHGTRIGKRASGAAQKALCRYLIFKRPMCLVKNQSGLHAAPLFLNLPSK